jgi:GrpB-like predicted nucleotidyltransferase (UPF0157 family)
MRGLSVEIEHVGSTSVPGLAAKPMLDVDILVQTTADVGAAVNCLERGGYRAKGTRGVPGREAFDQPPGALPPAYGVSRKPLGEDRRRGERLSP